MKCSRLVSNRPECYQTSIRQAPPIHFWSDQRRDFFLRRHPELETWKMLLQSRHLQRSSKTVSELNARWIAQMFFSFRYDGNNQPTATAFQTWMMFFTVTSLLAFQTLFWWVYLEHRDETRPNCPKKRFETKRRIETVKLLGIALLRNQKQDLFGISASRMVCGLPKICQKLLQHSDFPNVWRLQGSTSRRSDFTCSRNWPLKIDPQHQAGTLSTQKIVNLF